MFSVLVSSIVRCEIPAHRSLEYCLIGVWSKGSIFICHRAYARPFEYSQWTQETFQAGCERAREVGYLAAWFHAEPSKCVWPLSFYNTSSDLRDRMIDLCFASKKRRVPVDVQLGDLDAAYNHAPKLIEEEVIIYADEQEKYFTISGLPPPPVQQQVKKPKMKKVEMDIEYSSTSVFHQFYHECIRRGMRRVCFISSNRTWTEAAHRWLASQILRPSDVPLLTSGKAKEGGPRCALSVHITDLFEWTLTNLDVLFFAVCPHSGRPWHASFVESNTTCSEMCFTKDRRFKNEEETKKRTKTT